MDNKAVQFISDCWTIVRARGREDSMMAMTARVGWGLNPKGAGCYRDKLIEVVAEAEPSKRILVTNRASHNPVLCTDENGSPFRWHGEYTKIAAHVRLMALQIQEDSSSSA